METENLPQPEPVVTLEWDNGPVSVIIDQDWPRSHLPEMVMQEALHKAQQHTGEPAGGHDWRWKLSMKNVAISELKEFNQLIDAAAEEEALEPPPRATDVHSQHLHSRWFRGSIVGLTGDPKWMYNASRQALADEFLEVLTPPADEDHTEVPTTARDRLVRFMGGQQ